MFICLFVFEGQNKRRNSEVVHSVFLVLSRMPLVKYGWESWTIMKTECRRINVFELWSWRRLLRVPWTVRRSSQSTSLRKSNLNIHWKDWCWSWSSNTWPSDVKSRLIWKDPDAGKDWNQEETGMTEDEMVGWHHWLNGHEFEQTQGDGEGQGSLACCSPWSCKELDMTERLNGKSTFYR